MLDYILLQECSNSAGAVQKQPRQCVTRGLGCVCMEIDLKSTGGFFPLPAACRLHPQSLSVGQATESRNLVPEVCCGTIPISPDSYLQGQFVTKKCTFAHSGYFCSGLFVTAAQPVPI